MSKKKSIITDITPADGNVFEDLGFSFEESIRLKIKSDAIIAVKKMDKHMQAILEAMKKHD